MNQKKKYTGLKYSFSIIGLLIGFVISFIGLTAEDLQHNIPVLQAISEFHHFVTPIIIGIIGGILGFILGLRKIQRKNSMNEILTLQEKYKTMTTSISDVIAIIDTKGIIQYKSPNIHAHFGWHPDDLINKEAWVTVHPDDMIRIQQEFATVMEKENNTAEVEYRYKCKDGRYKMINLKAINLASNPSINGLLANYHDITERKRFESELETSERKYRSLYENMPDAVCIIDSQGRIADVNPHGIELLEYSKEELSKMTIKDLVYEEDQERSKAFLEKLKNEGYYEKYEGRVVSKSGEIKWIQVSSTQILENGIQVGSQDVLRDISKRKELESSLQKSKEQLLELNATKDKFFSIIAHDLKGPFNSIIGFTDVLLGDFKNFEPDYIHRMLKTISASAVRTLKLLENLLEWARLQRGQIKFIPVQFDILELIVENINLLEPLATKKNINITLMNEKECMVYADKNMINAIIRNLISNAIKFTAQNGKVYIDKNIIGNQCEVSVKDTGIGIPAEDMQRLFKIEGDLQFDGTEGEKGTGLGLILCKEFVERHGEKLWAESEINKGSLFYFTVPVRK